MNRHSAYAYDDLIMECEPFAKAVHFDSKGFHCDNCLQPLNKPVKCLRCRKMYYCSADCKRQDSAAGHGAGECVLLARDMTGRLKCSSIRLMLRIWFRLSDDPTCRSNGGTVTLPDGEGTVRSFADLMSHSANIRRDPSDSGLFREFWDAIREVNETPPSLPPIPAPYSNPIPKSNVILHKKSKTGEKDGAPDGRKEKTTVSPAAFPIKESEMLSIYGKIRTNAFVIRGEEARSLGEALYIAASIFDHSCRPNAVTEFEGQTLRVRATREIRPGEEIFIAYLDADLFPRKMRREKLQRDFYFLCNCERCLEEEMQEEMAAMRLQEEQRLRDH